MLNHIYKSVFLTCCCCLTVLAAAQESLPEFSAEKIILHTDRQLYISGETIWFKVFNFAHGESRLSDFSKVAYLELINQQGIAISRVKVGLEAGQGAGTVELPAGLNSGYYQLRAYTQTLRNQGAASFSTAALIILQPGQALVRPTADEMVQYAPFEPTRPELEVDPEHYLHIELTPSEEVYPQRDRVSLEITTTDAAGRPVPADLSLAVSLPAPNDGATLFRSTSGHQRANPVTSPARISYPAETFGMRMEGRVVEEGSGAGAAGVEVFLAFPGKAAQVYADITEADGSFSFLLPKMYGLRQIVLQARSKNQTPLKIELKDEFHEIAPPAGNDFVLPPRWIPMANEALINAQVSKAYQAFERPPVYSADNQLEEVPFFGKPDKQYLLDDYTRFPLPEFYFEVVLEVMVRGKYGEEHLELWFEQQSPFGETPPLLLVDGVPVFDERAFLKINNKLIASTELVTSPYWLNPVFFNGIIQLSSFEHDARCIQLPESALQRSYLTLLPQRQFVLPDYASQADSRLPDFRNTLYWNPSVQTNEQGKATISFYTSDALGDFEIRAEGVSSTALAGSARAVLQVAKQVK